MLSLLLLRSVVGSVEQSGVSYLSRGRTGSVHGRFVDWSVLSLGGLIG